MNTTKIVALQDSLPHIEGYGHPFNLNEMPAVNFSHIISLTDDTGMIQHANHSIPNRKEGYCIDDNSRALLFAVMAFGSKKSDVTLNLLSRYLSFVHYMQKEDGSFHNFMSYAKICPNEDGSEDSYGRTIMALGFLIKESPSLQLAKTGMEIFNRALPLTTQLVSLRGIANTIIGICQFIKFNYPGNIKADTVIALSNKLMDGYRYNKSEHWKWFDNILTYDNAVIPLALLNAYEVTLDKRYLDVAMESMTFLESVVFRDGFVSPVGNMGWFKKGGVCALFDQQGIDTMAMILYYQQAFQLTRDQEHLSKMCDSYRWFLGKNDLGKSLYDPSTGGCFDGLQQNGVNYNQGAESTLAYWISHLIVSSEMQNNREVTN